MPPAPSGATISYGPIFDPVMRLIGACGSMAQLCRTDARGSAPEQSAWHASSVWMPVLSVAARVLSVAPELQFRRTPSHPVHSCVAERHCDTRRRAAVLRDSH